MEQSELTVKPDGQLEELQPPELPKVITPELPPEIIIPFNGMTAEELKLSDNKFLMNWDVIKPPINELVLLRKYEVIKGYIISEKGIQIVVGFKDRRKAS